MAMNAGNSAYDFSVYEADVKREAEEEKRKQRKRLKRLDNTSSLHMAGQVRSLDSRKIRVAAIAVATVVLYFMAYVGVQMWRNETANDTSSAKSKYTVLLNDYDGLMARYDSLMNDEAIKEYAEDVLGMQTVEDYQVEWVTVGDEDEFN